VSFAPSTEKGEVVSDNGELLKGHVESKQTAQIRGGIYHGFDKRVPKSMKQLDKIRQTPLMKLARPVLTHMQKEDHYGQVVPMEDVEKSSTWCRARCGFPASAAV